eukprot:TRINITY_DN5613_c0_g1_i3.p1 TRINITY_DN5613_c0_g1~~TRINITY_DN5613_c0_g1_i3.p1  ORF type:complete len:491 (+),score=84.18 TRINITY_DN5613_c0_g1_i3:114-1586(+)
MKKLGKLPLKPITNEKDNDLSSFVYTPRDVIITPLANSAPSIPSYGRKVTESPAEEGIDEAFLEEYLSAQKLRELAGVSDLARVKQIDICVDAIEHTLGRFGDYIPNVRELKMNDSKIPTFRHLGTSLTKIEILWVARCGITDLGGISSMPYLKELYLSYNQVQDLSPLSGMECIEVIDLECNSIESIDTIGLLSTCPRLSSLILENNPICRIPHYREHICRAVKSLKLLDDRAVTLDDKKKPPDVATTTCKVQSEIKDENSLIEAVIKFGRIDIDDMSLESITKQLSTMESRPTTPRISSGNAASISRAAQGPRPTSANSIKPTIYSRPASSSGNRATPSSPSQSDQGFDLSADKGFLDDLADDISAKFMDTSERSESSSSHLTHGSDEVFCGNPVVALRGRKAGPPLPEIRKSPAAEDAPKKSSKSGRPTPEPAPAPSSKPRSSSRSSSNPLSRPQKAFEENTDQAAIKCEPFYSYHNYPEHIIFRLT